MQFAVLTKKKFLSLIVYLLKKDSRKSVIISGTLATWPLVSDLFNY